MCTGLRNITEDDILGFVVFNGPQDSAQCASLLRKQYFDPQHSARQLMESLNSIILASHLSFQATSLLSLQHLQ